MKIYNFSKYNDLLVEIFIVDLNSEFEYNIINDNISQIISNIYIPDKKDNTIIIFSYIQHYINQTNNLIISFNNNNEKLKNDLETDLNKTNKIITNYLKNYKNKKIKQFIMNFKENDKDTLPSCEASEIFDFFSYQDLRPYYKTN